MQTFKYYRILNFFVIICLSVTIVMFVSGCEDDPILDDTSSNKKQGGSYGKINLEEDKSEDNSDNGKVEKLNRHNETF